MIDTVAIIGGTGPEGRGLALRWARAGIKVIIGSRNLERAQATAQELAQSAGSSARIEGMENAAAVAACPIVVLTVPFEAQAATLKGLKSAFRPDTLLLCATVPLAVAVGDRVSRLLGVWQGSAAEQAAELVPAGVKVAGAFHNISAALLQSDHDVDCDVIVCSDDPQARQAAFELARKIPGVRPVDGGRLENSRIVEAMTALLIGINLRYKNKHGGVRITGLTIDD